MRYHHCMRLVRASRCIHTQPYRLAAALLALLTAVLALASCPQSQQPASTGTAGNSAAGTPPAADTSSQPPAGEQAAPATGEAPSGDTAGAAAEQDGQQDSGSSAGAAQDEKAVKRPTRTTEPDFIPIDVRFVSAEFNEAPNADLSRLRFEFRAQLDRMKYEQDELEISSAKDTSFAVLKLPQCIIEIYPQVTDPEVRGRVIEKHTNFVVEGRYVLLLRTPQNQLIGKFTINALEGMRPALPEHWGKGYSAIVRYLREARREDGYDIRKTDALGRSGKSDELFGLRFDGAGYESLDVIDKVGNKFTYQFPRGQLRLLVLK